LCFRIGIRIGALAIRHVRIGTSLIDESGDSLGASFVEGEIRDERCRYFFTRKPDNSAFPIDMTRQLFRHVVKSELLGVYSEPCGFAPEFPIGEATIYLGLLDLLACWQRAGSERENVYFSTRLSQIESVDQANQDRVIRPKTAVDEYVISVSIIFGMIDCRERAIDRCCSCCQAHIDERVSSSR
jgi:hypothetical protein